jgi:hypothetical protein
MDIDVVEGSKRLIYLELSSTIVREKPDPNLIAA